MAALTALSALQALLGSQGGDLQDARSKPDVTGARRAAGNVATKLDAQRRTKPTTLVTETDVAAREAERAALAAAARRRRAQASSTTGIGTGRSSTLLTGPRGLGDVVPTGRTTLLGY